MEYSENWEYREILPPFCSKVPNSTYNKQLSHPPCRGPLFAGVKHPSPLSPAVPIALFFLVLGK